MVWLISLEVLLEFALQQHVAAVILVWNAHLHVAHSILLTCVIRRHLRVANTMAFRWIWLTECTYLIHVWSSMSLDPSAESYHARRNIGHGGFEVTDRASARIMRGLMNYSRPIATKAALESSSALSQVHCSQAICIMNLHVDKKSA